MRLAARSRNAQPPVAYVRRRVASYEKCIGMRPCRHGSAVHFGRSVPAGVPCLCISRARCHRVFTTYAFPVSGAMGGLLSMHSSSGVPEHGRSESEDTPHRTKVGHPGASARQQWFPGNQMLHKIYYRNPELPTQGSIDHVCTPLSTRRPCPNRPRSAGHAGASSRTSRVWTPGGAPWRGAVRASSCGCGVARLGARTPHAAWPDTPAGS